MKTKLVVPVNIIVLRSIMMIIVFEQKMIVLQFFWLV